MRRAAIVLLPVGVFFSVGGIAVAVSALAGPDGQAAQVVYPQTVTPPSQTVTPSAQTVTPPSTGDVAGNDESGGDEGEVLGNEESSETGSGADLQAARQASSTAGADKLPFTGLAAIPMLLMGAAMLLVGGRVLKRSKQP